MRTDINGIIAEIAKKIETEGRETIFACFEHTDSIDLGIDGADVWVALDSQQDGADGGWNSTARLEIYYGDGDDKYMELESAETVSYDDFEADPMVLSDAERSVYGKLIDEFFAIANRA